MSLITTLARMEAVTAGRAQPAATVRHRHLTDRPLVLVPLTTAGEAGAPLGAMVGTDPRAPLVLSVPQPRDRTLRFAFLADLADALLPHMESAQDDFEHEQRGERDPQTGKRVKVEVELCTDAPQLLVPSLPGVEYVRLLGRSMRFRRTAEDDPDTAWPAPSRVPLLGRWLTHYGERARVPGSSLLLAMTELLGRHWATGQSRLEDQHLGALLAWIRAATDSEGSAGDLTVRAGTSRTPATPGVSGISGAEAALHAELARDHDGLLLTPPAGPATDPVFDNKRLTPALARYDAGVPGAEEEIHALIASQLRPTWDAVWEGVELLRALPPGGHVAERWKRDRWSYTSHRDRLRGGEPPQPRRDDAVTAARKLAARETAQAQLEAQEALDDPLVMAARRLAGEAFEGEVVAVETAYSEGKRPMPRPVVTVRTTDSPLPAEGQKLFRAVPGRGGQPGECAGGDGAGLVAVRLTGGMGRGKVPDTGSVPEPGDRVCWTLFEHAPRGGPELPDPEATPWTHGGPPSGDIAGLPDPVTAEDVL